MAISKPFFVRPLDLSPVTTGNEQAGFPASNVDRREQSGLVWKTSGIINAYVRGDFGSAKEIDFCALIGTNAQAGSYHSLTLSNNSDLSSPVHTTGANTIINPSISRTDGLYHSHLELSSPVSARYWQVGIGGHTGDFEASAIVIGKKITPSRFYNFDFEMGVEDLGSVEVGRFGVVDEVPGKILRTLAFTLGWQTRDEFEESFRPMMEELGTRGVVYFCMRPDATTLRQANTYMGFMRKPGHARGIRKPETLTQEFELLSLI